MRYLFFACLAVLCFAVCGPLGEESEESAPLSPALSPLRKESELTVTKLKVPDGTRVRFMLGLVGCGVMEFGKGEAVVKNGSFELPFDANVERPVDLFLKVGDGKQFECDLQDEILRLADVTPTVGAIVDASAAESTSMGCWLFGTEHTSQ